MGFVLLLITCPMHMQAASCLWLVQVVFSGVIFFTTPPKVFHFVIINVFSSFYSVLHTPKCTWTSSIYLPCIIITSSASIHMLAISLTKQTFKLSVHVCSCHLTAQSFKASVLCSTPPHPQMLTLVSLSLKCLEPVISYSMTCGH